MKTIARITGMNTHRLDRRAIARAAEILHRGAVVLFPTSGLYGLGADAFNARAVARIFDLKGRDPAKPLLVLVDSPEMVARVAQPPSALARHLMTCFWPGRVTLVVPALADLPQGLTGPDGTIGVRQVAHPVAAALVRALGSPLTGTSANLSGAGGCASVADLDPTVRDAVDLVLDAGPLAGAPGSTVVEVKEKSVTILREGVVPRAQIIAAVEQFAGATY
ncbi:MAG: threonylcarbamoyl-AMP synthase [Desulfobacterales bacterium]|nr:threonylcarbamoyl-AMP synthase [Desulfobacterales bacterium]